MKPNPWPDFLFALAVRFVCGIVLGGLACFILSWRGILWAFSRNHTHAPLIWLGLCALAGGLIAVFTVPRWQTPWYKRDPDELTILRDMASKSPVWLKPGTTIVKETVKIRVAGPDGQEHEYSSMDQVPPEIRSQLEALQKEAALQKGTEISITGNSHQGNTLTSKTVQQKNISVYKIVDESGAERTYHSLDEMPPEIRAAIEEAEKNK
jgi:hypothetical protein